MGRLQNFSKPRKQASEIPGARKIRDFIEQCPYLSANDPTLVADIENLHSPPRGEEVERDRLNFYLERASQTRFGESNREEEPTPQETERFKLCIKFQLDSKI